VWVIFADEVRVTSYIQIYIDVLLEYIDVLGCKYNVKYITSMFQWVQISKVLYINGLYFYKHTNRVMVFNATFNNINSVISWRSVLLVGETGVPGENHRPVASH